MTSGPPLVVLGSVFLPVEVLDPLVGALRDRGHDSSSVEPGAATSPEVLDAYVDGVRRSSTPVVLAHSNAGNYVPGLVNRAPIAGAVFLDAALPPFEGGAYRVVPARLAEGVAGSAEHGLLPAWTRWWSPDDVRPLFPDEQTFRRVDAACPRVPARYLETVVEAPAGWAERLPSGYLALSGAYETEIGRARTAGWPVSRLDRGHLAVLSAPGDVADAVDALLLRLPL